MVEDCTISGGGRERETVRCGREHFAQKCSRNWIMVIPQSATASLAASWRPTKATVCAHVCIMCEYLCIWGLSVAKLSISLWLTTKGKGRC